MKKISLFIAIVLFAGLTARAENYIIKIRGTITSSTGRTRVKETDLVRTNGNVLVYQIDTAGKEFSIIESDSAGVEDFGQQVHSDEAAVYAVGHGFTTDLHWSNGFDGNVGGIPDFQGRLIGSARIVFKKGNPQSFHMKVYGIWNNDDNSLFKGTISGKVIP